MKRELEQLIKHYKEDNVERNKRRNTGECSEYEHTVKLVQYNATSGFIKVLESLLRNHCD